MPRLSDTQTMLFSAAAARKNRSLLPTPETLKPVGKTLDRALVALVKRGLAAETHARSETATWRRDEDGARIGLVITAAGLAAIGVENTEPTSAEEQGAAGPADGQASFASRPGDKLGAVLTAAEAKDGATIGELAEATA